MFESKINRGKANGYAPLDGSGKVPLDKLPPIQSPINTGSFATTNSNQFNGNQSISGSLTAAEFIQTSTIQATGSLFLQPDLSDNRHFEIYNTNPNDTHIKANGGLSFFGDDTNYLLINDASETVTIQAHSDILLETNSGNVIFNPDGRVYVGSNNAGNEVITDGYLSNIIGDTDIINSEGGNTITDVIGRISSIDSSSLATTSSLQELINRVATTGSNQFNGNQSISGSLLVSVSTGIPSGVSNWDGQGGWNQGSYTNVTASGGTGTGLTVDVAAGGGGYININAITINTPGSGYTNGDVVTINNENNLPGQFTVEVEKINTLQVDGNGNLILDIDNVPTNPIGSIGDTKGTLKINHNSIYFATQSYVQTIFYVNGYADGTHVIVPNVSGLPNIQSTGWTITINGDPYDITGAYPPNGGDNFWYLEYDNLNTTIYTGTQLMTLVNDTYERHEIWGKIDFGFEKGKFVENALTSSIVKRVSIPTSLTGSVGDKGGTIAFDSGAIYFANDSYYGTGPFTTFLYENTSSSPNFPIRKGNFPKPKIGWTLSAAGGFITATVTNVVEYTDYWLVYTNGSNSSVSVPTTITLTANGLFDNIWIKNDFGFERGKFATTGSNQFNGNQTITGSLSVSGSNSTIILPNHASAPTSPASGALYFNTNDFHFYGWNGGQWKQLDN